MSFEPNFSIENLNEMKADFRELRSEIQSGISADPDYNGEADVVIFSIDNLLEELDLIKSPKDIDLKKKVKIDALIFWVSKFLPSLDGDYNEDDEDYSDEDDDEDEDDFFFDQLEITQITDLPKPDNNKAKPKSTPPKKDKKK